MLEIVDEQRLRVLRLDRPERKNALTGELIRALMRALREAAHDDEARARHVGHLGRLYRNLGFVDKALTCTQEALHAAEGAGDREMVGRWKDRLGLVLAATPG